MEVSRLGIVKCRTAKLLEGKIQDDFFVEPQPNGPYVLYEDYEKAQARIAELERQLEELILRCEDSECTHCSVVACPNKDPLHFHHDGCPSCDT